VTFLFDTSTWIWTLWGSHHLSNVIRDLFAEREQHVFYLSAASVWEIAIKSSLGRLDLPGRAAEIVPDALMQQGVRSLPITNRHALTVADLPFHHADPFDRLLIAQAQTEGLTILTRDREFRRYDVEIMW
jgi:PIN domain nuclease of toxin-antitoxin system